MHPETLLRIKVEIDTDPIPGLSMKNQYIRVPIPVSITTIIESDLFACKMYAALYRAWKNRVKGRDWYDVVWFIRKEIPLNLAYLEKCMHSNGQLNKNNVLDRGQWLEFLREEQYQILPKQSLTC